MPIQRAGLKILFHIWMLSFLFLHTRKFAESTSDHQFIKYLKKFHRFGREISTDYYFSCTVTGKFVQWKFNDVRLPILGADNTGSRVGPILSNYNYIVTLPYSQPSSENPYNLLVSLLIVSSDNGHLDTFNITCLSNNYNATREVKETNVRDRVVDSDGDGQIKLDYILSDDNVVPNKTTSIFICGARNDRMYLQIGRAIFFFAETDYIGYAHTNLSMDGVTVMEQSILVARQPYDLVTFIFTSGTTDVNVTCYFDSHNAMVSSSNYIKTQTSTTTLESSLSSERNLAFNATSSGTNNLGYSAFFVVIISILLLLPDWFSNKKQKDSKKISRVVEKDAIQKEATSISGLSRIVNYKSAPQGKPKCPAFKKTTSSKADDFCISSEHDTCKEIEHCNRQPSEETHGGHASAMVIGGRVLKWAPVNKENIYVDHNREQDNMMNTTRSQEVNSKYFEMTKCEQELFDESFEKNLHSDCTQLESNISQENEEETVNTPTNPANQNDLEDFGVDPSKIESEISPEEVETSTFFTCQDELSNKFIEDESYWNNLMKRILNYDQTCSSSDNVKFPDAVVLSSIFDHHPSFPKEKITRDNTNTFQTTWPNSSIMMQWVFRHWPGSRRAKELYVCIIFHPKGVINICDGNLS